MEIYLFVDSLPMFDSFHLCYAVFMKGRYTEKRERRIIFRGWRRHIGVNKKIQFEESRKKILSDLIVSEP